MRRSDNHLRSLATLAHGLMLANKLTDFVVHINKHVSAEALVIPALLASLKRFILP